MHEARRANGRTRGSVAIEFALVAPVLLVLVAGVLDWGVALERQISLVDIARRTGG